ncbi:MAG: phospholipase [Planctomycetes bacterium]|nr:phospholipase [Planctomycetota bacterium]
MTEHLLRLPDADLQELVKALRANRLEAPYTPTGVHRIVSSSHVSEIAVDLQGLADQGFSPFHIATTMEMMVKARSQRPLAEDLIDLVTTGPEAPGVSNRDTSVVVRELFAHAQHSVLVAGYAVYQGQRVFQALANRMEDLPELQVRMFLDIQRGHGDTATSSEIARRFADRCRKKQWPEQRKLPEVFFDPRALEADVQKKACLHAKCVVVDRKDLFVSSANFTEAAQERNVEVGLLIHSSVLAGRVQGHFEALLDSNMLARLF